MPSAVDEATRSDVKVTRISGPLVPAPAWSLAIFAHNEAPRIRRALESIRAAAADRPIDVIVLANGCTDSTADVVRACGDVLPSLSLADIALGDKANAWNVYVHDLVSEERAREITTYFFMDGDVTIEPGALALLATALNDMPSASAAGAMPATGRDKEGWRDRMVRNGMLAGNLYALRGRFVDTLRREEIRMPTGLIGEDLFLSWLVAKVVDGPAATDDGPRCIFCSNAEFAFDSLSPARVADYRVYFRRKWRYTLRALQLEMLMHVVNRGGLAALPRHVDELYASAPLPSRLRWVGLDTPMRLAAVLSIRAFRKRVHQRA